MKGNFNKILDDVTAPWEGGKVNDPVDPGGKTNAGITQSVYDADRTARGVAKQDVYLMSDTERRSIYERGYWNAAHCDEWQWGVDASVFDWSVNSGVSRGVKKLQTLLASVAGYSGKIDGWVGVKTIAAAKEATSTLDRTVDVIRRYNEMRTTFVRGIGTFWRFGKGWINRITDVTAKSVAMAVYGFGLDATAASARLEQEAAKADQTARDNAATAGGAATTGTATAGGGGAYSVPHGVSTGEYTVLYIVLAVVIVSGIVYLVARNRKNVNNSLADSYKRQAATEREKINGTASDTGDGRIPSPA